jgi:hypothetical protein
MTNPRGDVDTYRYDDTENLKSVTNGRGFVRTNYYPDCADLYYASLPDGSYESFQFHGNGVLSKFPGFCRSTINYGYDNSGRMTVIDYTNIAIRC